MPQKDEPEADLRYRILYDDKYYIGIEKSGDLPVHPAGPYFNNTLTALVEHDFGVPVYPVHRLDRETSGVVLFARTAEYASRLSKAWDCVEKEYRAVVSGNFKDEVTCDIPIGPAYSEDDKREAIVRKKRAAYPGAPEPAKTLFYPIEAGREYSLIGARLCTGRQHQIRAHLRYLGYPIAGDKIYGTDERFYLEFITTGMTDALLRKTLMKRCALHSYKIVFQHPVTGKKTEVLSPLYNDINEFLRKYM